VAACSCTVKESICRRSATLTFANHLSFGGEINCHAAIKGKERTFPERVIAKLISLANDSTFNLIDLFKSALDHYC
jgi:hypothetical protein